MAQQLWHPAPKSTPKRTKVFSSSVLILEAAIATLVLSVFVSSDSRVFVAQRSTPRPATVSSPATPQNQLLPAHSPMQMQVNHQLPSWLPTQR